MNEENKEPTFINDCAKEVYDIDTTSMYDANPIEMSLNPSNILGKINIPDNM